MEETTVEFQWRTISVKEQSGLLKMAEMLICLYIIGQLYSLMSR
jgi:hypothetical protein